MKKFKLRRSDKGEKYNIKITNLQMKTYTEKQRLPNLQEIADGLCEDEEMEYVYAESKIVASLNKIDVGNNNSIFTKIKKYPYEFEIDSELKLASIDGVKVSSNTNMEEIDDRISRLEGKITRVRRKKYKFGNYNRSIAKKIAT